MVVEEVAAEEETTAALPPPGLVIHVGRPIPRPAGWSSPGMGCPKLPRPSSACILLDGEAQMAREGL